MYDQWLHEVDNDKMVGIMMVDLSAAFDMVDHSILMQKLKIYGLDNQTITWVQSYISGRSQAVMVDGALSPALSLMCGVPQGSILGPLLYILFTNEIPDLVHDHQDDSTYSYGDKFENT